MLFVIYIDVLNQSNYFCLVLKDGTNLANTPVLIKGAYVQVSAIKRWSSACPSIVGMDTQ